MDIDLDSSPVKESKDGDGMTNGGGGGSVFDIAMEEMTREEVGEDEEKKEGDQESPSSLKTKGAVKEVENGEDDGPKDAFDAMLSGGGDGDAGAAKTTIHKDAFDSMLSGEGGGGHEGEGGTKNGNEDGDEDDKDEKNGGVDDTVLSVPDTPAPAKSPEPEVVVSSSEEDVETEVETEVEIEEEEPFNICTSMVGHMVASPPEDFEPKMVKKTVKKMVKRTVRRKKGWKTKKMTAGRKKDKYGVITLDDEPWNRRWAAKIATDEEYFRELERTNPDALEWFKENGPKIETAGDSGLKCTCCFKAVSMALNTAGGMWRHALLGVGVCKKCRDFYKDGSGWEKDSEGLDIYCRWNGQGGEIILCDKCPNAFSRMAIQRNLGRAKMQEITAADEWKCPECDPKQIYEQQALYWAVWQRWKSGNYTTPAEEEEKKKAKAKEAKVAAKAKGNERQQRLKATRLVKDPKNFVDENLSEAFKTLNVYQKCLEQERDRWVKAGQNLNVNSAAAVCRALRKIYAITKQNMDLLDKAVVQSFVENFPRDSTRIHMGKVGIKVKEGNLTGKPTKIKPGMKVKLKTPTKKKSKKSFVLNGSPVYADPDEDDIFVGSGARGRGKAKPKPKPKPKSAQKKRRYSSDDDIICLSDDDGPGKKKSGLSIIPLTGPSAKKKRPGPASRTGR